MAFVTAAATLNNVKVSVAVIISVLVSKALDVILQTVDLQHLV